MEAREYDVLAEQERTYWWFRALRGIVGDVVAGLGLPPGARVLDAGYGTGATAEALAREHGVSVTGVDVSALAARRWPATHRGRGCLGSVNALPFATASFDAVVSADVLCCALVSPALARAELVRVLRPGGRLVLWLPAYAWLLSAHDRAVHCVRRTTARELGRFVRDSPGLSVERVTYCFPLLFPAIAAARLLRKRGEARSDVRPLPRAVDRILGAVAGLERRGLRAFDYPFGTTVLCVARKAGPP